ncbi:MULTISPECIES: DUF397 domain-containing protein [unclassified Kitasatospora]|uniref:DUF397 domain-containing protein n=1 Tax=unclassified Kitasatospora TaxID=2633591 RepID=UPI00382F47D0
MADGRGTITSTSCLRTPRQTLFLEINEATEVPGTVHVRDFKDRSGPQPAFAPAAWRAFVEFAAAVEV